MNMNPLLINIVVSERELEIQRQKQGSRRDDLRNIEPAPQPKRKKPKRIFGWSRRRQPCESS